MKVNRVERAALMAGERKLLGNLFLSTVSISDAFRVLEKPLAQRIFEEGTSALETVRLHCTLLHTLRTISAIISESWQAFSMHKLKVS